MPEVIPHALAMATAVAPFAVLGLVAWGKFTSKIDSLANAVKDLSDSVKKLDERLVNHGERIAVIESSLRAVTGNGSAGFYSTRS